MVDIAGETHTLWSEMRRQRVDERAGPGGVLVVQQQSADSQIHECESHGPAGAACADQQRCLAGDSGGSEALLEAAAEADTVGVVANRPSVAAYHHGVDRADLRRLR